VVSEYKTKAVLYKREGPVVTGDEPNLKEVKKHDIIVNYPLEFEGFGVYQVSYKLNEFYKMSFYLERKLDGEKVGEMTFNLHDPEKSKDLKNGYRVEVLDYFPDFDIDPEEGPTTKSKLPNNPLFIFKMFSPENPKGEISLVAIRQNVEPFGENDYKMSFKGLETRNVTALTVRKDKSLWVIAVGGFIFMIGVVQGMYWNHRRIWIQRVENEIWVAAHTNRGWFGFKKEIELAFEGTQLVPPDDHFSKKKEGRENA
jgi:cytochrome c biogenesis protein